MVGYSTIWLAEAARADGGQVTTINKNEHKTRQARETLAAAGLAEVMTFISGYTVLECAGQQGSGLFWTYPCLFQSCIDCIHPGY